MKRSWIGLGLLLVLLAGGIGSTWGMTQIHNQVEEDLKQAADRTLAGDWDGAGEAFLRAWGSWKEMEHFRACFADHTPVEEIDGKFELIRVYWQYKEDAAFAAECQELARKAAAVGEAHEFVWWNFF